MHAVLLPFGSAGDVFPFLWLGRLLKTAGNEVTVITSAAYEKPVRAAGLAVLPLGSQEEFDQFIADPRVWKLFEGTKMVFEVAGLYAAEAMKALESLMQEKGSPDLLLAPCTVFGARLAREKYRIPLVTVHVQPAVFISAHELPVLFAGMEHVRKLPLWLKKALIRLPNPADRIAFPAVKKACASHGVSPPQSLWWDWGHSPDGVLALFPEWFCSPQPDWPAKVFQWHFPLEDTANERPLSADVRQFLESGDKPVVFTPGSANIQARRFFETALESMQRMNRRAIFVTRKLEQLPPNLPASILAAEYEPFSLLVPHAAAFVHHGGIGTLSQGFAAGVPQLIMAMAHDQPDNAYRLEQLGAGLGLTPRTFTPEKVTAALNRLLQDPTFAARAADCRDKIQKAPSPERLLQWLEARVV